MSSADPSAPPPRRSKREHHPSSRFFSSTASSPSSAALPPSGASSSSSSRRPQRRRVSTPSPAVTRTPSPSASLVTSPASSQVPSVRPDSMGIHGQRRRLRAAAHSTTTSLVTAVYMQPPGTAKLNQVLAKYSSQECTLLCEVILSQLETQTMAPTVLDEEKSPACIRWEAVAKTIQTTHRLNMNARDCQQLWKFLAYGQIPSEQSGEAELLSDSDEEDFQRTPRQINAKLAAEKVSAEKKKSEDAVKLSEQVKTPVTETAVGSAVAEAPDKPVTEKEAATESSDKEEVKTVAAAMETRDEAPDESVDHSVKKSVTQATATAEAPGQPKAQSEVAPTDEAGGGLVPPSNDAAQGGDSEPSIRLYPTYTLPTGAPDSWHRPFNPKKSLPLTFVASRFLKRKPQPVSTKPVGGGPAIQATAPKLPSSAATGIAIAGAARLSTADLKRKQVAPVQNSAAIKKTKLEISPSAAAASRIYTPSSTPPPAAKRARTQLEFFELRLREERAKAQNKTELTAAEIQRLYGEASMQVRRECQELAVHDIDRYNRELVRVRIWEKAVGSKSMQPKPVAAQPASQKPTTSVSVTTTSASRNPGPAAALLAHAAAVAAAAEKAKASGALSGKSSATIAVAQVPPSRTTGEPAKPAQK
ncbi:hypothetical protein PHYBOEH_003117 [Phytophthora boehmeriae]|uniref:Uncharacterized protein n=1 Tax=Phytophthora boehmeriae TaxID=109152 RepID=A0A8T1WT61_9STRA|nr:hypothetical protein PHYBOEH_003117 [Phytophthora boehmeriae]